MSKHFAKNRFLVRVFVFVPLIIAPLLLIVVGSTQSFASITSNLFPSSTPLPAYGKTTHVTPPGQGNTPPSWVIRPSFANKVLHWSQTVFAYTVSSPDRFNGQAVTGDVWLRIGTDGLPTIIHARYTQSDGTLLQEFIQTRNTATSIFGTGYPDAGCHSTQQVFTDADWRSTLPLFVNILALPKSGYTRSGGSLTHPLPITTFLPNIVPANMYNKNTLLQQWMLRTQLSNSVSDIKILEISADNRLVAEEIKLVSSTGTLIQDNWHTYGTLQVYNPNTVPTTIFALTSQMKGACNG